MYFLLSKSSSYNLQCKHRHFDSAVIFVSSEQSSDEQMMVRPVVAGSRLLLLNIRIVINFS